LSKPKFWWTSILSAFPYRLYAKFTKIKPCNGPLVKIVILVSVSLNTLALLTTEDGWVGFFNGQSHARMSPRFSKSTRELDYFCTPEKFVRSRADLLDFGVIHTCEWSLKNPANVFSYKFQDIFNASVFSELAVLAVVKVHFSQVEPSDILRTSRIQVYEYIASAKKF